MAAYVHYIPPGTREHLNHINIKRNQNNLLPDGTSTSSRAQLCLESERGRGVKDRQGREKQEEEGWREVKDSSVLFILSPPRTPPKWPLFQ